MEVSLYTEQKQLLSQKTIESLNILQMSAVQLNEYIQNQFLENPVLELAERQSEPFVRKESEKDQWIRAHDEQNRSLYQKTDPADENRPDWNFSAAPSESLRDYLWSQLLTRKLSPGLEKPLQFLLESLDSRGYFTDSLELFARRFRLTLTQAEEMLSLVRSLEPAGVGARDLQDCLCLQLERQGKLNDGIKDLIDHYLPDLAKNRLPAIARNMNVPLRTVEQFASQIRNLDPRPGASVSDMHQTSYIIPDVIVVRSGDQFDLHLNESLYPDISINRQYLQMSKSQEDSEIRSYLTDKIKKAEWLQQCIAQRNSTLLSVCRELLSSQYDFFQSGASALKPLRQADIALTLRIHESTVSRAVKDKYLQCSWGIFPLQYFFAKKIRHSDSGSSAGKETAATVSDVKKALKEIIHTENKQKPCSDRQLAEQLNALGFSVSRRTVAKYREEELIPPASGRRDYHGTAG